MIELILFKSRVFKSIIFCAAFVLMNLNLLAQIPCDPNNNGGFPCDEDLADLPLDSHIWVLIAFTMTLTIYWFNFKRAKV